MFIPHHALEDAGLDVVRDENGLSIQGRNPVPKDVRSAITVISKRLEYTPRECDELMVHVCDVPLVRKLLQLSVV